MKTITFNKDGLEIPIRFEVEENTIWMTQKEIALLFNKNSNTVRQIISRLNRQKLLNCCAVRDNLSQTGKDGKHYIVTAYSLDIIKQLGYKLNPTLTEEFINWCNEELKAHNNQLIPIGSNIIRFKDDDVILDVTVLPNEETVYLSQEQLAILFDTTIPNISMHIKNIYESGELEKGATIKDFLTVQIENGRQVTRNIIQYNLDLIISLGFRVNSKRGIVFRKWATKVLKEYMIRGYVINNKRTLVTDENYINLIHTVNSIDKRVSILENEKNINLPKHKIITDGEILDAVTFVRGIIESANKSIVIIDPWCDFITMSLLNYKKDNVLLYIITSVGHKISEKVLNRFPKLKESYMYITEENHARYLIIDDTVFYRFGPSINHIGDKFDQANKEEDIEIQEVIRRRVSKYIDASLPIDKAIMK